MEFNDALARDIGKSCGSKSIQNGYNFYRRLKFLNPDGFWFDFYGNDAYYVASKGKNAVRLVGIAVRSDCQKKGIGRMMFYRLVRRAKEAGISRITFRTSIYEDAQRFYARLGCAVVGLKDDDFEMEYTIKQ